MEKDKELIELFKKAKFGDKDAQKSILTHLYNICRPLINGFYPNVKKLGINYQDLEDLVVEVLFTLFEKLNLDEVYDFENVCRFYYLKAVQNEIRYLTRGNRSVYKNIISLDSDEYNGEIILASKNYIPKENGDLRNVVMQDEIYNNSIVLNKAKLTLKEKGIIILFLNSHNIKEIAIEFKISYQTAYKHIKNALSKLENFIKVNYSDIYKMYN